MIKRRLLTSSAIAFAMAAGAAHAQAPGGTTPNPNSREGGASPQQQSGNTIAEVVVTAEKREQSLQDVPVAISAFTSEQRDLIGIVSVQDLTNFTPGLQYTQSNDRTSLRGVGRLTNQRTAEGGVAIYSDGVYTTSTVEAGKSPLFVDRVEVLRGPQGTLYGRNSISGAINVISKRPTEDWYAEVRAQAANYDRTQLEGAVSGPITEGIQFRLAGSWEKQDEGYFENVVPGMPSEGNVIDQQIYEGQLQFQAGENFDGWVKVSTIIWNNGAGAPGARAFWAPNPYPTFQHDATLSLNAGYGCRAGSGPLAPTNVVNASPAGCVNPAIADERKFASTTAYDVDLDETYIFAGEFTYHLPMMDVKYVGGAVNYHYHLRGPDPATQPPITAYTIPSVVGGPGLRVFPRRSFLYEEEIDWMSHEINLSSTTDGPFQWLAGVYYFKEQDEQPVSASLEDQPEVGGPFASPVIPGVLPPGFYCSQTGGVCAPQFGRRIYDSRPESSITSKAVYGQIDWEFVPTFTLTAGLRYSDDKKEGTEEVRIAAFGVAPNFVAPEFYPALLAAFGPAAPLFGLTPSYPLLDLTGLGVNRPAAGALPRGVTSVTTFDPATGLAKRSFEADWQAVTGTLGVKWEPDTDTNIYGRYSRGFKAGGFRVGIDTTLGPQPFTDAEYADSYEFGAKKNFFNDQLQVNAALFRLDYENAQIPVTVVGAGTGLALAQGIFFNVPEAVSQGFELETIWQPIDNLQILFNYAYLDTEVKEGRGVVDPADPTAIQPGARPLTPAEACNATNAGRCDAITGFVQRGQDLTGNHLPNAPENKIALNANYTVETSAGDIIASATYTWRDEQYGSIFDRDYWKSPAYDQVDARITFRDRDDRYSIILYGRNLTDDIGYEGGPGASRRAGYIPVLSGVAASPIAQQGIVEGISRSFPITPPRTFGIELQYRFF
jgi:iron complex outermembrane receptor protein